AGVYTQPSYNISRPATGSRGFRKAFVALGALLAVAGVAAIALAMLRDSSVPHEEPRAAASAEPVELISAAGPSLQADEPEETSLTNVEERSEPGATDTDEPESDVTEQTVTVQSEPSNALVSREGVLIGNTPIEVSAPERGAPYELELKAEGYRDARVRISHLTQSPLSITLERDRVRVRTNSPRTAPRRERRANKTPEPTPMVAPVAPAPVQRMNRMPQSEVLDPWASDG
ncbi:MAG: PEGA domain-containing protein, partial [Myxococcota bacterium]